MKKKKIVVKNKTRFVVTLSVLMLLAALVVAMGGNAMEVEKEPVAYTVFAGDTLWDIAVRFAPANTDVRCYIEEIKIANDMTGDGIYPNQILLLP